MQSKDLSCFRYCANNAHRRALRDSMSTENTFFPQPGPSRLVDGSLPAPVTSAGHGNINAVDTQFPAINGMPRTSPLASSQAASSSTQTQPQGLPFQSGFAMTMAHIQPLRQDQPQSQPQNQSQPHQSTNTVPAPQTAIQGIPSTHTNPTPTSTGPPRLDVSEYLDPPLPPPAHSPSTRHQHPEPTTELSDDQIGKSFGNPSEFLTVAITPLSNLTGSKYRRHQSFRGQTSR